MTDQTGLPLRALMPDISQLGPHVVAALRQDPQKSAATLAWDAVGAQATDSVLNVDVLEALAQGWCMAKELHEYTDTSKHPTGEKSAVYLGAHAFTKTVYPTLTVTITPFNPVRFRFTLDLSANIRSVGLFILNGCITAVGTGDGAVSAQLNYEQLVLKKAESQKVQFPGCHDFTAPGLKIA